MIKLNHFLEGIKDANISFITGVPDSLLKDICGYIADNSDKFEHIIATNEGSAVGLAIGNYLATSNVPLVYMQNSGLGNIINPITSLADPQVYGIPMVLMIGWRGEIDINGNQFKDEPQHKKQGQITLSQLEILDIPYLIIDHTTRKINKVLKDMVLSAKERSGPIALVVRKKTFENYKYKRTIQKIKLPSREEVINEVLLHIPKKSPVISTTGVASRELYEIRDKLNLSHDSDFLTVGGMGHASQIASGIAISSSDRKVFCIDGDGATLMHMGSLAINADQNNLIHILINNCAHDSVGGQPTKGDSLNFSKIAKEFGYRYCFKVDQLDEIGAILNEGLAKEGSLFIEILCMPGFRSDLGRPNKSPKENKKSLIKFLKK